MKKILAIVACLLGMAPMARAAAPVISNVLVTATTPTSGTITWTTDIPSTSMLQYGTTPAIPYQTNVIYMLTTTHSMTLPLLTAGPLYYVAAVSGDNAGNNTQSATITFSVCGNPTIPVSGTVNNYYEYGSYALTWIPPAGTSGTTPTACGVPIQTMLTGSLSGSASFSTSVADASKVVPGPGEWEIEATDAGNLAPVTTYAYLAQSSQDVSPALQALAASAGLTACITNTITGAFFPSLCGGSVLKLQHNGVNLADQTLLNFNDTTPAAPSGSTNVIFQTDSSGDLSGYVSGSGSGCGTGSNCVITDPTGNQTIIQPDGTNFLTNILNQQYWANLFGTGSNGIETVYGNSAYCLPQGANIPDGCSVMVPPLYTLADAPQGWNWTIPTSGLQLASGAEAFDYRNGTFSIYARNPINPTTATASALTLVTSGDQNLSTRNYLSNNGERFPTGLNVNENAYAGGWDFQFYPYMTQYVGQDYRYGQNLQMNNYTDGIDFGEQEYMYHRGLGDAILHFENLTVDGGILAGNSEGTKASDTLVQEDPSVFRGTLTSGAGTTTLKINCAQDCGSQGPERLAIDVTQGTVYNFFTSENGPETTGSAENSAVIPPSVTDSSASYPVSTMIQLCNAGSNNGAGGAAGCTAGSQPIGVIPPLPLTVTITGGSVSGGVGTFTNSGTQGLVAGQTIILYDFSGNGAPLNNTSATVLSSGLSTTGFQVSTSAANISSTGSGTSTQSPTGFSPAQSVTLNVVAPYTGTGGDTNGLPSGFCSSSSLQSSNSGSSCYMPASGSGCLTDGVEYEYDNYIYNSGTQQITITNMMFPHLNGVVFATGGLCGYAVEDTANAAPSNSGATGVIAPTYSIAGSISGTQLFYVPQRTNEQYGSPLLGLSNPSNGNPGNGAQLYFSEPMSSISNSAGVVTFNMNNPPQVGGSLNSYNGLTATISTANSTYNGNYAITWVSGNTFTYTPTSPSGTLPTSGTITYNNAAYTIYPAARVESVYDTANNQVDGTLYTMPSPGLSAFANGDTIRLPHYQQFLISGNHLVVSQFQPEQYYGSNGSTIEMDGLIGGKQTFLSLTNATNATDYAGYGGSNLVEGITGYSLGGVFGTDMYIGSAPDQDMFEVLNCKSVIGCSSRQSNWNIFTMPDLPGTGANSNGSDVLNYDPNYESSNRGTGLYSGKWKFGNDVIEANEESNEQSFATVEAGYLTADQAVSANNVNAVNIFTTQSSSIANAVNPVGTTGSTTYDYWIVGNAAGGGQTLPVAAVVHNGNATLSGTNYNQICIYYQSQYKSYDILKGSTSTSIALGITVNGSSATPAVPANYACFNDTGGSTSAYTAPTANTTGGVIAAGPIVGNGIQNTSVTVAGCAQYDSFGNESSTGTACGSGGGGGSVTSVAMTVPDWLTVSGSPITSTGTFAVSGTSEPANYFIASPNGSSGAVSARAIVAADIPTLNQSTTGTAANVTGIVAAANGGTGISSSSSTGVPQVSSGTWTISTTLPSGLSVSGMTLTSPTLITAALGTPASGVLTHATGLPLSTGVTGNLPNANLATQTANTLLGALTATTPSGIALPSCSGSNSALTWTTGTGFGCNTIYGAISGLTAGYIPLAGSATSITANSHLNDGVTTPGIITSTEPLAVTSGAYGMGFGGSTSGQATVLAQAVAGTPTLTLPINSGQLSLTAAETVAYSATPTFTSGDSLSVVSTLTGNITSFTLGATTGGSYHTLCFIQGTGSYTVTAPSNVHGLGTIGVTSGKYNCQNFIYYAAGSVWLPVGGMQTNL